MEPRSGARRRDAGRREAASASPLPLQAAAEAARNLERTIAHFESVLGQLEGHAERRTAEEPNAGSEDLESLKRALREVVRRLEDAVDQLGSEARRLSDEAARLTQVAGQLARTFGGGGLAELAPEPEPGEPQFRPGGQAVGVVLAAVPGFQGLMDVQRALNSLPAAERASVVGYKNGEASLDVALRAPVSARQIVEELRRATGYRLLIEEARPETQRLRLRFVEQDGGGFGARSGPTG